MESCAGSVAPEVSRCLRHSNRASMSIAAVFLATFASVLLAEIVGDRSMIAVASLASRFRVGPVLAGAGVAYALKMLAAVLVADAVARAAPWALAAVSGMTWAVTAWVVWRREPEESPRRIASRRAPVVAFATIALTEWGDPGQLTAALLTAHFRAPLVVWCAATAALLTKAAAASLLGTAARRHLNALWLRGATAGFCAVNAAVSMFAVVRRW